MAGILSLAGIASAHAHLQKSNVRPGSVLTTVPDKLDLSFTENLSSLELAVYNLNGDKVSSGTPVIDPADKTHATVPLQPGLMAGTYTVRLHSVADDGHDNTEGFRFYIAAPAPSGTVRVFINGQEIKGDVQNSIVNGRTMAPVRTIADALGKVIDWNPEQQIVTINDAPATHEAHGTYKHPDGTPAPTLSLQVTPDKMRGFNLNLSTTNWTWAPDKINTATAKNQGHAHLYVDGVMVNRVYGSWYHLEGLTPGEHDIRVTLNTNDHSEYATPDGDTIDDVVSVVVSPDGTGKLLQG